jgi:hypothetical protein
MATRRHFVLGAEALGLSGMPASAAPVVDLWDKGRLQHILPAAMIASSSRQLSLRCCPRPPALQAGEHRIRGRRNGPSGDGTRAARLVRCGANSLQSFAESAVPRKRLFPHAECMYRYVK